MRILVAFLLPLAGWAADFTATANFRVQTTTRSAVISYVVPQGAAACTWEVSESSAFTPLVHDVDPTLFVNSNRDDRAGSQTRGSARTFVLGQGGTGIDYAPVGSNGIRYSRALQVFTQHYGRVTCGSDTATVSFRTANLAGDPTNEDIPFDPAGPAGEPAWPYLDQTNRAATVIDPQTGVLLKRLTFPRQEVTGSVGTTDVISRVYNPSGSWTNPNNALNTSGSGATCSGTCATSQSILVLNYDNSSNGGNSTDLLNVLPTCGAAGSQSGDDGKVNISFSLDQSTTPYGIWLKSGACAATIGAASEQIIGDDPANAVPQFIPHYLSAWLKPGQAPPRLQDLRVHNYVVNTSSTGNTVTATNASADAFYNIVAGSVISIPSATCGSGCVVATFIDGFHITLTTDPGNHTGISATYSGFSVLIQKTTNSSNAIELRSRVGVGFSIQTFLDGGGGQGTLCSNRLQDDGSGKKGYFCATENSSATWSLWWIAPVDGEVRHLGSLWTSGASWNNQGCPQSSVAWDTTTDASYTYIWCVVSDSSTGKPKLIKGKMQMAITDVGPNQGGTDPNIACTVMTSDIQAAVHAKYSAYDATVFPGWDMVGNQDGYIVLKSVAGQQDSYGWIVLIKQSDGSVYGGWDSITRSNCRWCGIHTAFANPGGTEMIIGETWNRGNTGNPSDSGPFYVRSTTSLGSSAASTCGALAPGNVLGLTTQGCDSLTSDGNNPMSSTSVNPLGASWSPGDLICMNVNNSAGTTCTELIRLVALSSGTTWVVQRGYSKDQVMVAHSSGDYLKAWCNGAPYLDYNLGGVYSLYGQWQYETDPDATNANDPHSQNLSNATIYLDREFSGKSHQDQKVQNGNPIEIADACDEINAGHCPGLSPYNAQYGIRFGYPRSTNTISVGANTPFSGVYGLEYGDIIELHPSKVLCDHDSTNDCENYFVDDRANNMFYGASQTVTAVGGTTNLFKITNLEPNASIDIKRQRLGYQLGRHVAKDISGPGSTIQDGSPGFYTSCFTYVAGECHSGSSAGDIYVNVPTPTPWPTGSGLAGTFACFGKTIGFAPETFPCAFELGSDSDFVTQYGIPASHTSEPYGIANRRITRGLIPPAGSDFTANARNLPDGSWIIFLDDYLQNRLEVLLAKLPPWNGISSINRTDFIPIALTRGSVPAGTDNVIVRFGYTPSFYCTRRQEACIANSATLQTGDSVLSFEGTDSYNGLACSSGCMVTIPALSQRVMWYQWVFRNGSNNIIGMAPIEVLATP